MIRKHKSLFFGILLTILFLGTSQLFAQTLVLREAENQLFRGNYEKALSSLKYLKEQGVNFVNLDYEIAICRVLSPDQRIQSPDAFFEEFSGYSNDPYFNYWKGVISMRYGRYGASIDAFEKFLNQPHIASNTEWRINDVKAAASSHLNYLNQRSSDQLVPFDSPLNSYYAEISPVLAFGGQALIFTTDRGVEGLFKLMISTTGSYGWGAARSVAGVPDNVLIVSSNDSQSVVLFDPLEFALIELNWNEGKVVVGTKQVLPTLAGAESLYINKYKSRIIFSKGRSDGTTELLETLKLRSTNEWTTPTLLAGEVNSEGNEGYPFLTEDRTRLYFSSDRPGGVGGLDIYYSDFDSESLVWKKPVNLGLPTNSPDDEIAYRVDSNGQIGILASNRTSGKGDYDMFLLNRDVVAKR